MNIFDQVGADLAAIFNHPSVSIPPELQPQVDAIKSTVAQAAVQVEQTAVTGIQPAVDHEITVVLNHNHLAAVAPFVKTIFDAWYAATVPTMGK